MTFKVIAKVIFSSLSLAGVIGGAYIFSSPFKSENKSSSSKLLDKKEKSINTELIEKQIFSGGNKVICKILIEGEKQEKTISEKDCLEKVKNIWRGDSKNQPYLWLKTNKEGFEEEIRLHSISPDNPNEIKEKHKWKVGNSLECSWVTDSQDISKVVVTCDHLNSPEILNYLTIKNY